jgi:hypothetical protein
VDRIRYERPSLPVERSSLQPGKPVERPDAVTIPEFPEFLRVAGSSDQQDRVAGRNSPSEDIADFVTPRLKESAVLHGTRSLAIFEELVGAVIPTFKGGLGPVAMKVIHGEIARRRDLQERLHRGISA